MGVDFVNRNRFSICFEKSLSSRLSKRIHQIMDANLQQQIRREVVNTLAENQNVMMSEMKNLITTEMGKMQQNQQRIADSQMSKIEN